MDAHGRIAELEVELAGRERRIAEQEARIAEQGARIAEQEARIAALVKELGELKEKLGRNSSNSNLPPSSDPPGAAQKNRGRKEKGKRRRGGQPGHRGSRRELLPVEQVDLVNNWFPEQCEQCTCPLPKTPDPEPRRYQYTELPAPEPHTTEDRLHGVDCPRCKHRTHALFDPNKIPSSPFGPRLISTVALLTGVYHLSRRKTVQLMSDLLGVRISLGAVSAVEARVSDAVKPAVEEACEKVAEASVKHTDGTGWLQAGKALALWTIATACATVFKVVDNSRSETLKQLYGKFCGILVSDRATALNFWAMERRQICWAHLLRKFISFQERAGPTGDFGRQLLEYTSLVFTYWHDYREKRIGPAMFRTWMAPVREQFEALLDRAVAAQIDGLSGSCKDVLAHRAALWNFVDHDGVEPTNNNAERELRAFVLWRKRSFGTQSERGNRFAENLMTIAHTARKQNKNVLEFLTACCVAHLDGDKNPSLFEPKRDAA